LNKLGARTHGNWAMFRLPFDANRLGRLRAVRFTPSNAAPTDVGSIRIGSVCLPSPSTGSIESWTLYTTSGVGYTRRYERHPAPPTSDPTIASINVPTRVANYVACGWDAGRLRDPDHWKLRIDWEER
ncbi:MAG TPA: hypothetical protein VM580_29460, partial [Labilithrix sp.]|nr:hypothetical protein [Labilithrix sp.]